MLGAFINSQINEGIMIYRAIRMILKGKYLETSDNVGIRWKRYQLSSVALKKSVIFVVHRHLHFGT